MPIRIGVDCPYDPAGWRYPHWRSCATEWTPWTPWTLSWFCGCCCCCCVRCCCCHRADGWMDPGGGTDPDCDENRASSAARRPGIDSGNRRPRRWSSAPDGCAPRRRRPHRRWTRRRCLMSTTLNCRLRLILPGSPERVLPGPAAASKFNQRHRRWDSS